MQVVSIADWAILLITCHLVKNTQALDVNVNAQVLINAWGQTYEVVVLPLTLQQNLLKLFLLGHVKNVFTCTLRLFDFLP